MPELPEVQSVVNYLRPIIINQTIASVIHLNDYTKVFETHSTEQLNKQLAGQKITNVWRRGKYIIIDVAYGHLCIHLRMTGQLQEGLGKEDNLKHYTALMALVNGCEVYFKDYRKFGRIYFFEDIKINTSDTKKVIFKKNSCILPLSPPVTLVIICFLEPSVFSLVSENHCI